ncbi:MAG: hypothetical protein AAGH90_03485 [Pseudomonadota bacterium]
MSYAALLAGVLAALTCLIHTFIGGREVARPLLSASDLETIPRLTSYYCWHLVTGTLALMSAGYFWLTWTFETGLVWGLLGLSVIFAILPFAITLKQRVSLSVLPQWVFFLPLSGLSIAILVGY